MDFYEIIVNFGDFFEYILLLSIGKIYECVHESWNFFAFRKCIIRSRDIHLCFSIFS